MLPLKEAGFIFYPDNQISEILHVVAIPPIALFSLISVCASFQPCRKCLENTDPAVAFCPLSTMQSLEHRMHSVIITGQDPYRS